MVCDSPIDTLRADLSMGMRLRTQATNKKEGEENREDDELHMHMCVHTMAQAVPSAGKTRRTLTQRTRTKRRKAIPFVF